MGKHTAHHRRLRCLLMWLLVMALGFSLLPQGSIPAQGQETFWEDSVAEAVVSEPSQEETKPTKEPGRPLSVTLTGEEESTLQVEAEAPEKALLPADTVLHVDEIPGGDLLRFYMELATLALPEDYLSIYGEGLDLYLTSESAQGMVKPADDQAVTVTVDFGEDPLYAGEPIYVQAFHIEQEEGFAAVPVPTHASPVRKDRYELQKFSFEASAFSPYVILACVKVEEEELTLGEEELPEESGWGSQGAVWEENTPTPSPAEAEPVYLQEETLLVEEEEAAPEAPLISEDVSAQVYPVPTIAPYAEAEPITEETLLVEDALPGEGLALPEEIPALVEEAFLDEPVMEEAVIEENPILSVPISQEAEEVLLDEEVLREESLQEAPAPAGEEEKEDWEDVILILEEPEPKEEEALSLVEEDVHLQEETGEEVLTAEEVLSSEMPGPEGVNSEDIIIYEENLVEEPGEELAEEEPEENLVEEDLAEEDLAEEDLVEENLVEELAEEPEETLVEEELTEEELSEPEENLVEEALPSPKPEDIVVILDEEGEIPAPEEDQTAAEEAEEAVPEEGEEQTLPEENGEEAEEAEEDPSLVNSADHKIQVRVVTGEGEEQKDLAGVKVSLQRQKEGTEGAENREEVTSFTSEEKAAELSELSDGVAYTLVVTEVPEGYALEPIVELTFTLKEDGSFAEEDLPLADGVLLLTVKAKEAEGPKAGKLYIHKSIQLQDASDETVFHPLVVEDLTTYIAIFQTLDTLEPTSLGKELRIQNASQGTVVFEDLKIGEAYTVAEAKKSGDKYTYFEGDSQVTANFKGEFDTARYDFEMGTGDIHLWLDNNYKTAPSGSHVDTVADVDLELFLKSGSDLYPMYTKSCTYLIGAFEDEACTKLASVGEAYFPGPEAENKTTLYLTGLTGGKSYWLTEVVREGEEYKAGTGSGYQILFAGDVQKREVKPTEGAYTIADAMIVYDTLVKDGPYLKADFDVQKVLITEDDELAADDDVFYLGIYGKEDCKDLLGPDRAPVNPVPITNGNITRAEVHFSSLSEARSGADFYFQEVVPGKEGGYEKPGEDFHYDVTYTLNGTKADSSVKLNLKVYPDGSDLRSLDELTVTNQSKSENPTNTPTPTPTHTPTATPTPRVTGRPASVTPTPRPSSTPGGTRTPTPTSRPRTTTTPTPTPTPTSGLRNTPTPTAAPAKVNLTVTETLVLATKNGEISLVPRGASAEGSMITLYRDRAMTQKVVSGQIQIRGLLAAAATAAAQSGQGSVSFRGLNQGQTYYLQQGDSTTPVEVRATQETNLVELKKTYTSFPSDNYVAVVPLTLTMRVQDASGTSFPSQYGFRVQLYTKPIKDLNSQEELTAALAPVTVGSTLGRVSKNAVTFSKESLADGTASETVDVYLTSSDIKGTENGQITEISTVLYASEVIRYQEFYYPVAHSTVSSRLGTLGLSVSLDTDYPGSEKVEDNGTRISAGGSSTVTVTNVMSSGAPGTSPTPVPVVTGMQTLTVTETLYLHTAAGLIPLYPRASAGAAGSTITLHSTAEKANPLDTKQIVYAPLNTQNGTAGAGSVVFMNLAANQTYYIGSSAEENTIPFTVGTNNNENVVRLNRIVNDIPENCVAKGDLTVTKVLQDANGNLLRDNRNFVVQLYTQDVTGVTANATLNAALAQASGQTSLGRVSKNRLVFNNTNAAEVSETVSVYFGATDENKNPEGVVTDLSTVLYVTEVTIAQSSNGESTYYPVSVPSLAERFGYEVSFQTEYPGTTQVANNGTRIMAGAVSTARVTNRVKPAATPTQVAAANNGTVATNTTPLPGQTAPPAPTAIPITPAQAQPLPTGTAASGVTGLAGGAVSFLRNIPGIGGLFVNPATGAVTPVRTGDRTPIILYLGLLCGAGVLVIVILLLRRRGLNSKGKKKNGRGSSKKGQSGAKRNSSSGRSSAPTRSSSKENRPSRGSSTSRRPPVRDDFYEDDEDFDEWRPRR